MSIIIFYRNFQKFQYLAKISEDEGIHRLKRYCSCSSPSCPCSSNYYPTGYGNTGYGNIGGNGINFNTGYGNFGSGFNWGYPYNIVRTIHSLKIKINCKRF